MAAGTVGVAALDAASVGDALATSVGVPAVAVGVNTGAGWDGALATAAGRGFAELAIMPAAAVPPQQTKRIAAMTPTTAGTVDSFCVDASA